MTKTSVRDAEMPDWDIPQGTERVAPTVSPASSATYLRQPASPLPQNTGRRSRNRVPVAPPPPTLLRRRIPRVTVVVFVFILVLALCTLGAMRFGLIARMYAPPSTVDMVSSSVVSIQPVPGISAVPVSPGTSDVRMESVSPPASELPPAITDAASAPPESSTSIPRTVSSDPQSASSDPVLPGGIVPLLPETPEEAAAYVSLSPVAANPDGTCTVTYGPH
jgi:hypothetical protein